MLKKHMASPSMILADAHCHLQDASLLPHLEALLQRARQAGVGMFHVCGTGESDWDTVCRLAQHHPEIAISLGLHPWYAANRSANWLDRLKDFLARQPSGIGEIGLDRALEPRNDQDQEIVFRTQLALSYERETPVSIHCRKAWDTLVPILEECGPHPAGALIHSFSGSDDLVPRLTALNVFFSFSGSITRSGNKRGRRAARAIPADRLLIESDAPDIMPALNEGAPAWLTDQDGKPLSEPAYLPLMAQALADIRGVPPDALAVQLHENFVGLFERITA